MTFSFFLFHFFMTFDSAFAQGLVKGRITGRNAEPLPFATIGILSRNAMTTSDLDGRFSILANPEDTLEIYYLGYYTAQIPVGTTTEFNITLRESTQHMDELVIVGYGSSRKKDLTGAASHINFDEFNGGMHSNPMTKLQGKVSGVQISSDYNIPGGAVSIKIRGNSALSGAGQPLYVLDGVLLDGRTLQIGENGLNAVQPGVNPLNFINSEDIESIEVLKDASATAIYGSRAAYGVVIINTKKGREGQASLNVAVSTGVSDILKKVNVLSASQFRNAIKYYEVDNSIDKGGNVDPFAAILHKAIQQNYTIGVSGGSEGGKYRLTSNISNQQGIIDHTGFKKYGINLTTNFIFLETKKLGLDINAIGSQSVQDVPVPEYGAAQIVIPALKWNPTQPLINPDGMLTEGTNDLPNPLSVIENFKNNFKSTNLLASFSPYFKFKEWLEYRLLISANYGTGVTRTSVKQNLANNIGGTASIGQTELFTRQVTQTLNFKKNILPDIYLNAVAGYEFMDFTLKGSTMTGTGVQGIGFGNFGLNYTNYIQYSSLANRKIASFIDPVTQLKSYFARKVINYKDKYLLTGTIRKDGSSKFGINNKYGIFPSVAGAWTISQENFFKPRFIDLLKFRASWGITGNQEFPAGASQARYSFRDNGQLIQTNNPNADLKWQSDKQYNIGIDFSLFNHRISGTLDYFNKTTTDLLFPGPPIQPAPPGSTVRWINLDGKILNKGLEILIEGKVIAKENFSWELSPNVTFLRNKVTDLPAPLYTGFVSGPVQIIQNHLPLQSFFTRKFLGLDKATGLSTYEDEGATNFVVGNPNPKALIGLNTIVRRGKFSLSANMYGALGQDMFNATLMNFINAGQIKGANIALSVFEEPIKESLANPVTPSSRFIMKASYLKMSHCTIYYEPGHVANIFKMTTIYLTAQNLFLLTKYPGFDPETNSNASINNVPSLGIDYPHYPSSRTILLGLSFNL